jgi:hypothetical protein
MPEIPEEALHAASKAVMAKEWKPDAPWSVHSIHQYDSDCAVCQEDVPAMIAVAVEAVAPILAEHVAQRIESAANTQLMLDGAWAARVARETYPPTRTPDHPNTATPTGDPT